MSALALQRIAVRMLYDEAFLDRVYADAATATADCAIDDRERAWLVAPDRRAWRVDPLRRSRSLAGLVEEFAVSVATFVREVPGATVRLDGFFSSGEFHAGMQRGDSLADLFAAWFAGHLRPPATDFLRLEAALARVRRRVEAAAPARVAAPATTTGRFVLAPTVELLVVGAGTVGAWTSALAVLRDGALGERAIDPAVGLPRPRTGPDSDGVLVDGRGPRLETLSPELAGVLAGAAHPVEFDAFCVAASGHGADAGDCRRIVESFAGDGVLEAADAQA